MNVSFDGLRTNATQSMNRLYDEIKGILETYEDDIIESDREDLMEKFNDSAMLVDTFNCLYDDDVEGDLNNMENLSIDRFKGDE
jgi:hypothetical protein